MIKDDIPSHIEGSMRNINDRIINQQKLVAASEKIKESEEKFRSIFENMQDVYYYAYSRRHTNRYKSICRKTLSCKKRRNLLVGAQDFYYEPARYNELKAKLLKDGFINDQEVKFLTSSGETMYFSVNSKLINDHNGNLTLVEGTMRNINERINNQNKLLEATEKTKQSEEEFRAIFESFEDVYFRTTLDGYFQNVSPSVEKILKYKREDIIG